MSALHVVTGATGHVGANLVPALLADGYDVRVVMTEPLGAAVPALAGLPVERVSGDVRDRTSLLRAFAGADVVHHLAAVIHVGLRPDRRVRTVNVEGVANVVAACAATRVRRLVHVSSIHAMSTGWHVPRYDRSKAAGERIVAAAVADGLDAVIVRPTGVIGPRDFAPSRMGQVFLDLARRRLPALMAGGFNWVDVRDVANALIAAADRGQRGETYVVSGYWRSLAELAQQAGTVTGVMPPMVTVPHWVARAAAPVGGLVSERFSPAAVRALRDHENVACDLALRDLGHWPRPMADTIGAIYKSFAIHRGNTTPSSGGGNTTDTGMPMMMADGSTEFRGASAVATTLPTNRIERSSANSTTTTLYGATSA
jgi:dihydroflavonol-4-reductase